MGPTVPTLPQKPKKKFSVFLDTKMDRPSNNHNVLNGIEFLIIELVPKLKFQIMGSLFDTLKFSNNRLFVHKNVGFN